MILDSSHSEEDTEINYSGDNPALAAHLAPLNRFFEDDSVNEVIINGPGYVWIEKKGQFTKYEVGAITIKHIRALGRLIAQSTEQMLSEEKPLLSASLPNGYRVQIVLPPACESGSVAVSIRKPGVVKMTLKDYEKSGAFEKVITKAAEKDPIIEEMRVLLKKKKIGEFLTVGIQKKKNIVISGGTSTGKTTFVNAILTEIPTYERLITVEDTREINIKEHSNRLHLLVSKGGQGRAQVTVQSLIEACLRLRPDRIIVGEVRGAEAYYFLRAINTGHPGSVCTLHADTPKMAIEQLKLMVMQASLGLTADQIREYILEVVDVIVQLKRGDNGQRYVSEIMFTEDVSNE